MNFDPVRNPVYRQAIEAAVTPDSVVMDLGAGLGMLGFLAARAGARKVYLVEPEPVIEIARMVAKDNGISNVECIQATAETLEIEDKADVIISVFTGNFLLTEDLLPSLFHARDRFLAPGGQLLPDRARMMVAPVSVADYYAKYVDDWNPDSTDIDYRAARPFAANTMYYDTAEEFDAKLLAEADILTDIDFMTASQAFCDGAIEVTVERSGLCHGWLGWFDTRLGEQWLSTSPEAERTHWRQVFMPLHDPIDVSAGDVLEFRLRRPERSVWSWSTVHDGREQRQSTFLSLPVNASALRKKADEYLPRVNEDGEMLKYLLSQFDGSIESSALAADLFDRFPGQFKSPDEALQFVKRRVNRYSK